MADELDEKTRAQLIIARRIRDRHNSETLRRIGEDEKRHYDFRESLTETAVKPSRFKMGFFVVVSRVFGLTFAQDLDFKTRFFEMVGLSLGIAAFSFGLGYLVRIFLGVEVYQ